MTTCWAPSWPTNTRSPTHLQHRNCTRTCTHLVPQHRRQLLAQRRVALQHLALAGAAAAYHKLLAVLRITDVRQQLLVVQDLIRQPAIGRLAAVCGGGGAGAIKLGPGGGSAKAAAGARAAAIAAAGGAAARGCGCGEQLGLVLQLLLEGRGLAAQLLRLTAVPRFRLTQPLLRLRAARARVLHLGTRRKPP